MQLPDICICNVLRALGLCFLTLLTCFVFLKPERKKLDLDEEEEEAGAGPKVCCYFLLICLLLPGTILLYSDNFTGDDKWSDAYIGKRNFCAAVFLDCFVYFCQKHGVTIREH